MITFKPFDENEQCAFRVAGRTIVLERTGKRGWFGRVSGPLIVFIDAKPTARISYGKSVTLHLDPGRHRIRVGWPKWHALGLMIGRLVTPFSAPVEVDASRPGEVALCCGVTNIQYRKFGLGGAFEANLSIWQAG